MSSSSNSQPSSSEPAKWSYDVFFSSQTDCFITNSLESSLRDAEINAFIDPDHEEEINPALLRAIEGSRISIVLLTKEYGDSRKCLVRLEKIMECHRRKGQVVMPIYYDVNLWEVRKQNGEFGEAFEGLLKGMCVSKEKEMRWRRELSQIALFPGWDVSTCTTRNWNYMTCTA
ncbi:disease resistance protein TAO1-like isoform X2 [Prosopis cineraria]|uniref:disease resistance protein TAO1-like isoform X2 n=1 Tax=Prosopis cineraria TaxID=364024 RepID=UPI00240F40EC|nr:disease resistance protein TAO1-like isoform X2 [Prosopis cineraria]